VNLRFLETFVWVARLKSFSMTAEKLNSTQAAVSHRIAALERDLGVRLFERDPREVRLTPQGADALEHAERIVRLTSEFRRRMCDPKAVRGTVRIGVIDTIAYAWLSDLVDRVNQRYPEVVLEINAGNSDALGDDLEGGLLDLGLLMGPVRSPGMTNLDLCSFACRWVASPRLGIGDQALEIEDLIRFPILSFPRNSQPHAAMLSYIQRLGLEEARLHTAPLPTLIRLAIDGMGIAAVPVVTIDRDIAAGSLVVLQVHHPLPPIALHAAFLDTESRPLPALIAGLAAEAAADFCRSRDPSLAW
jgi:DNA-binding transcriptional LysR family regulator